MQTSGQIRQLALKRAEGFGRFEGLGGVLDHVDTARVGHKHISPPDVAVCILKIIRAVDGWNQREDASFGGTVAWSIQFRFQMAQDAANVFHQGGYVREYIGVDALADILGLTARVIKEHAVGVVDVAAAIGVFAEVPARAREGGSDVVTLFQYWRIAMHSVAIPVCRRRPIDSSPPA